MRFLTVQQYGKFDLDPKNTNFSRGENDIRCIKAFKDIIQLYSIWWDQVTNLSEKLRMQN